MSPQASFLVALATLLAGMVSAERLLGWYAPKRFIPETRLERALRSEAGCVIVAGDSRMVAGYDETAFREGLRASGREDCVATIAIGALRTPGLAIAVRRYLERGKRPDAIVLGITEDTLLAGRKPPDPADFIGNEAVILTWSELDDVRRFYPGFPFDNLHAFDQGFRFLAARSNGLGRYVSLVWQKVQAFQDRVTGREVAANVFGALADMEQRGRAMERTAREELASALERPEEERLDPWFVHLESEVARAGSKLVLVVLPMPEYYRNGISRAEVGTRYRDWLAARLARKGNALVDLTSPEWLDASHFADFVHLNAEGARLFSRDLGRKLGELRHRRTLP